MHPQRKGVSGPAVVVFAEEIRQNILRPPVQTQRLQTRIYVPVPEPALGFAQNRSAIGGKKFLINVSHGSHRYQLFKMSTYYTAILHLLTLIVKENLWKD